MTGPEEPSPAAGTVPPANSRSRGRRVIVSPPEGTDPTPEGEPDHFSSDDNDDRLKRDVPPHWG